LGQVGGLPFDFIQLGQVLSSRLGQMFVGNSPLCVSEACAETAECLFLLVRRVFAVGLEP